ncbi:hypothetical protein FF100_07445 [Methylobacterium terricola]|uniref:Uncharacterized protein n=1 Tax=Methylobacterium terricola TaxID=2583531 RepID=A0A5C4LII8_9HYPH|nr:hypothetical protein [Methylobacterium terricola]TNC14021.1 hypothetical protein FF100_07445 [Methylobacterium terricola]
MTSNDDPIRQKLDQDQLSEGGYDKIYSASTVEKIILDRIDNYGRAWTALNYASSAGMAVIALVYSVVIWSIDPSHVVGVFSTFILLAWMFWIVLLYHTIRSSSLQGEAEAAILRDYSDPSATLEKVLKDILIEVKQSAARPVLFQSVPSQKIFEFIVWAAYMLLAMAFRIFI